MKCTRTMPALAIAFAAISTNAFATDRVVEAASVIAAPVPAGEPRAEALAVQISAGGETLWSGTLRIGGKYGNASFSQSTSEYAMPCPGEAFDPNQSRSTSHQLRFNIGRRNWQQTPDSFNINVNWTRPLAACQGEGTNTIGFTRVLDLPRGRTTTVNGEGRLVVRMTRKP